MKHYRHSAGHAALLAAAVTLLLGLSGPAWAAEAKGIGPIMRLDEVRAGMKGHGLSTFKGNEVSRFEAEVLGVIRGWAPQGSIILVKMSGAGLEETGTISGMSGSPIYVDGKLLGAVAYGFYYCKIPLSGVRPAEEMLVVRDIDARAAADDEQKGRKAAARETLRRRSRQLFEDIRAGKVVGEQALSQRLTEMIVPACLSERRPTCGLDRMPAGVRTMLVGSEAQAMGQLPMPLAVGGLGPKAFEAFSPMLRLGGFLPVQAAVTGASAGDEIEVKPGVPIGAVLLSGDVDISGLGTVTAVDGNRVLAFGHDMFGTGGSNYPMAVGRVQTVVPSLMHSFRMSTPERIVGRIVQDRETAILGRLGEEAPTFPCTVRVKGDREVVFNYRAAGHWETAPMLATYAAALSATRWEGSGELITMKATSRIRLKGRKEPIVLSNTYATQSPTYSVYSLVAYPMEELLVNPFKEVEIAAFDFDIEIEKGLRAVHIENLRVDRQEARPGEKVKLIVGLKEFQGKRAVRAIEFEIPRDATPGTTVSIMVCDGMTTMFHRMMQDPGLSDPRDFDALVRAVEVLPASTNLYVHASFQKQGLRYAGEAMPNLPPSVTNMFAFGAETGLTAPLIEDVRQQLEVPWVVAGREQITVAIKEPRTAH